MKIGLIGSESFLGQPSEEALEEIDKQGLLLSLQRGDQVHELCLWWQGYWSLPVALLIPVLDGLLAPVSKLLRWRSQQGSHGGQVVCIVELRGGFYVVNMKEALRLKQCPDLHMLTKMEET